MTAEEIQTLRDLAYIARQQASTSDISNRLLVFATALANKATWTDADRPAILGYMAATGDGAYPPNRAIIDKYAAEIGTTVRLPSQAPTSQPAAQPTSSGGTIAGLSTDQIREIVTLCDARIAAGLWSDAFARIKRELSSTPPVYTLADPNMVEAIRESINYGAPPTSVNAYSAIIDQRGGKGDPDEGKPLPIGDPRWKRVSGGASVPVAVINDAQPVAPTPPAPVVLPANISANAAMVVAALAEIGIFAERYRLGVGVRPDPASNSAITVGGESSAVIDGISNTHGSDKQNPGEVHKNSLVVADNDGGMRARQYGIWGPNGKQRNTTNRPFTCFAFMDSWGDTCISDDRFEPGQCFYIVKSDGDVTLATYKQGWTISVKESVGAYGAKDKQIL